MRGAACPLSFVPVPFCRASPAAPLLPRPSCHAPPAAPLLPGPFCRRRLPALRRPPRAEPPEEIFSARRTRFFAKKRYICNGPNLRPRSPAPDSLPEPRIPPEKPPMRVPYLSLNDEKDCYSAFCHVVRHPDGRGPGPDCQDRCLEDRGQRGGGVARCRALQALLQSRRPDLCASRGRNPLHPVCQRGEGVLHPPLRCRGARGNPRSGCGDRIFAAGRGRDARRPLRAPAIRDRRTLRSGRSEGHHLCAVRRRPARTGHLAR